MISVAMLTIDRAAAGLDYDIDAVPAWQWAVHHDDLARICPSRLSVVAGRDFSRQRNALRCEWVPSTEPRCSRQSPDGRGLAWLMSGGSPLTYGRCYLSCCPRAR